MPRRSTTSLLLLSSGAASALQVGVPVTSPTAHACRRASVAPTMAVDDKVSSPLFGPPFGDPFLARSASVLALTHMMRLCARACLAGRGQGVLQQRGLQPVVADLLGGR
jgi:hypothetical protein